MENKNKNFLIALGIIVLTVAVIGGGGFFIFSTAKNSETTKNIRAKFSQAVTKQNEIKKNILKENNKETEILNKKILSLTEKINIQTKNRKLIKNLLEKMVCTKNIMRTEQ